ncbi:protein-L-isoaspartate(D-aspartate) O-methyltransferase [Allocatelliglobosispora scoriae]|uniref:Protein-L-isoaspartate O-methyltransferase n=1 Tax=Allocatelliglobosispora scoriae TaxID=643052 RepID=A0A841BJR8_9ACTN|nr:methyltransferase domain-containing protein [Allocatelliglobosispora scoriae]MBB5867022.1 protein-L-isoaspartate(D-aspartate) O-methyltransferase [Allocatelliglobosispora scoriae]
MSTRQELAAVLGDQLPPEWRAAFDEVPRELFVPDVGWVVEDNGADSIPVNRAVAESDWLAGVYSDAAFVTQHEGGRATSSSSKPSMVFAMLGHCDLRHGQSFLEIGTGTGWNAGLVARRIGDGNTTSIEIDAPVAARARENLRRAGRSPLVVTGDGEQGYKPNAPYDRVEATCSVRSVPRAWVEQTRPGGLIVAPWETASAGLLLKLSVDGSRTAAGRFVGTAGFMTLRSQDRVIGGEPDDFDELATVGSTDLDAPEVVSGHARTAVGLLIPDMRMTMDINDDTGYLEQLWFLAPDAWAAVDPYDGTVRQAGTRRLWDEVVSAHAWWAEAGEPEYTRFGVAVDTVTGGQWTFLDDPARTVPV